MPFEILSANGEDGERWRTLVEGLAFEHRDIHFLPDYGRIYQDAYGFEPFLAVYGDRDSYILQPFVRRPLSGLSFLSGVPDASTFSDLANPYGYGGPLSNETDADRAYSLYTKFRSAFTTWCEEEDIASEFVCLHPLMADRQREIIRDILAPTYEKDVVYIDLAGDAEMILRGLSRGHRSSVAKARRSGVCVERVEMTDANLSTFAEIYFATMRRRNAAERWFVPDNYFTYYVRHLGSVRASLFFARVENTVEVAYLLIHEYSTAYYHFGGTRGLFPEARVNNLLMYATAVWAQRNGYKRYYLGGGVTSNPDDTLLRFKAGFSTKRAPLYTYFSVRNRVVYDRLCERKRAYERTTAGVESTSDFVPLYRR
jgi:hypothetical protein